MVIKTSYQNHLKFEQLNHDFYLILAFKLLPDYSASNFAFQL
ncbi:hypothetical protein HMPREF3203_03734 [Proteus mirabilis]|nr:hypothetical protein HMPREF3203_03734 [Proteus mirabilis]